MAAAPEAPFLGFSFLKQRSTRVPSGIRNTASQVSRAMWRRPGARIRSAAQCWQPCLVVAYVFFEPICLPLLKYGTPDKALLKSEKTTPKR